MNWSNTRYLFPILIYCGSVEEKTWISCLDVVRNLYNGKTSASSDCNRVLVKPNSNTFVVKMIPQF